MFPLDLFSDLVDEGGFSSANELWTDGASKYSTAFSSVPIVSSSVSWTNDWVKYNIYKITRVPFNTDGCSLLHTWFIVRIPVSFMTLSTSTLRFSTEWEGDSSSIISSRSRSDSVGPREERFDMLIVYNSRNVAHWSIIVITSTLILITLSVVFRRISQKGFSWNFRRRSVVARGRWQTTFRNTLSVERGADWLRSGWRPGRIRNQSGFWWRWRL